MKPRRRKNKINYKNKEYCYKDSPFYRLTSKKRLANALGLPLGEIYFLANDKNYNCFSKKTGSKARLIQEPNPALDKVHTRAASLLSRLSLPDTLHSGRRKRTNISNAKSHLGTGRNLITMDIRNFFMSTKHSHVFDFFYNTMECAPDVAELLTKLLTYNGHIPTGSRVSMLIAYFANHRMFDELESAAKQTASKMTIYVDDITFSGTRLEKDFIASVEKIVKKHGHKINSSKTRFYTENQVKLVTGTAIKSDSLLPQNKHLKQLRNSFISWKNSPNSQIGLRDKIIGKLTYIGSINSRYKDKARTFRATSSKLTSVTTRSPDHKQHPLLIHP